jgi:hypothetical protein
VAQTLGRFSGGRTLTADRGGDEECDSLFTIRMVVSAELSTALLRPAIEGRCAGPWITSGTVSGQGERSFSSAASQDASHRCSSSGSIVRQSSLCCRIVGMWRGGISTGGGGIGFAKGEAEAADGCFQAGDFGFQGLDTLGNCRAGGG